MEVDSTNCSNGGHGGEWKEGGQGEMEKEEGRTEKGRGRAQSDCRSEWVGALSGVLSAGQSGPFFTVRREIGRPPPSSARHCRQVPIYQSLTRIAICSNLPMEYAKSKAMSTEWVWGAAKLTMRAGGPSGFPALGPQPQPAGAWVGRCK